jgi:hypothetical protein
VKAGKSVLIIDAVDTYGTDFASFTPAALQDALSQQQRHQQRQPHPPTEQQQADFPPDAIPNRVATAGTDAAPGCRPDASACQDAAQEHEHSLPLEYSPVSEPVPPGCRLLLLRQRPLPLSQIRALAAPGEGGGPADRRGYILDLVPKVRHAPTVAIAEPAGDCCCYCYCYCYCCGCS